MEKQISIKYKKQITFCKCCDQDIKNPKVTEREFTFTADGCLEWLDKDSWKVSASCERELDEVVEDFCLETISFFAINSDDLITVDGQELNRLKEFILAEVVA